MKLHRKSLLFCAQVAIVGLPVAVLLFLGIISYRQTKDQLTEMALSRRESIAHLSALSIRARLEDLKQVGLVLSMQDRLRALVEQQHWREAMESLTVAPKEYPEVDEVSLLDAHGILQADFPPFGRSSGEDLKSTEAYAEYLRQGRPTVTDVYVRTNSPPCKVISTLIPIKSKTGVILGTVVLHTCMDEVSEFSQWKLESELGKNGFVYVVDRKGNVVYHPKYSNQIGILNLSSLKAVQLVLSGSKGIRTDYNPLDRIDEVQAYEPVPGYGWGVVAEQPVSEAFAERDRTLHGLVVLYGSLMFAVGLCTLTIVVGLRELWRREEKFRQTVETTKEWFWVCDLDGRLIYSNPAVSKILAYDRTEVVGHNLMEFIYEEDLPRFQNLVYPQAVENKVGWTNLVLRWNHKQGGICYLESNAVQILDPKGNLLGFRGADRDISDRKLIEQQLEMSRDAALRSARAKADFLAVMSHEIRTPMNGVIGMTSILSKTELTAVQRDCVQTIKISGEALLAIINDILNFSKIESGRLQLDEKPFLLTQCLDETLDYFIQPIQEKSLEVRYSVEENVPETLIGDLGRLRQILSNLVGNAVKFTPAGKIELRITLLKQDADGCHLQFAVSDTGIGIPAESIPLLFQSFQQVDSSATRHYGGTGLGLAISKKLAELMRGNMWVESELGRGSTFLFTVVLQAAPPFGKKEELLSALKLPRSPDSTEGSAPTKSPLRLLLAEDHAINQKVILMLLQTLGYQVDLATNGVEVLEAVGRFSYQVVIMDIQMPKMDGIEAMLQIRRTFGNAAPRIIALTANALEGDRKRFLNLGFDSYLSKPLDIEALKALVETWSY